MPLWTICCLFYGDYPELAKRLLDSLQALPADEYRLRVGANELSARSLLEIMQQLETLPLERLVDSATNRHKYPVMRELLHADWPQTPYVMWFDDDSFVAEPSGFLAALTQRMETADMLGGLYKMRLQGRQSRWIMSQPWYRGLPVPPNHSVLFATGGWWAIRARCLQELNWPLPELDHRGGDVMLGEACRQMGYRLQNFRQGVAINADAAGRESKAQRRGYDSRPIGYDFRG